MSLMGYTNTDVINMMAALRRGIQYVPYNDSNKDIIKGINDAYDFLDGLVIEGRV